MYCETCGTKNDSDAKFCFKCGKKLVNNKKPNQFLNNLKDKIKSIPKRIKIAMASFIVVVIALIIILSILLNNPVKKVENYLRDYYDNYTEKKDYDELIEIGKIIKDNKEKNEKLEGIKKQASKTINNWVKNFNKAYKDQDELKSNYTKVSGVLDAIYKYYQGLDIMLDKETYLAYKKEIEELYASKTSYFKSLEYDDDNYQRYYYSEKVIEADSYYTEAQNTISKFLEDEIKNLLLEAEKLININDDTSNKDKYEDYLEAIEYLKENKYSNNLDLSSSEQYKNKMNEYTEAMLTNLKEYTKELIDKAEIKEAVNVVGNAMKNFTQDSDQYKELETLLEEYKGKLPTNLFKMYRVSISSSIYETSYKTEINDKSYEGALRYRFNGKTGEVTYRTNKEYTRFRTRIVIGKDWDKDFKVTVKISGDGKELYKKENITKETEISDIIDLDIKDIDDIKIEFITTSGGGYNSGGYRYLYLVEPYLYK